MSKENINIRGSYKNIVSKRPVFRANFSYQVGHTRKQTSSVVERPAPETKTDSKQRFSKARNSEFSGFIISLARELADVLKTVRTSVWKIFVRTINFSYKKTIKPGYLLACPYVIKPVKYSVIKYLGPVFVPAARWLKKLLKPALRRVNRMFKPVYNRLEPVIRGVVRRGKGGVGNVRGRYERLKSRLGERRFKQIRGVLALVVVVVIIVGGVSYYRGLISDSYNLSVAEQAIIGQPDMSLMKNFSYDAKTSSYFLNKAGIGAKVNPATADSVTVGDSPSGNTALYSAELPIDPTKGMTTYDNTTGLSFTMVPEFTSSSARQVAGHTVYPVGLSGPKDVYTVKGNGVEEDVVYNKAPGSGTVKLSYQLKLPDTLQAKIIPGTDNIGIYSASSALYGNISYGTPADQAKVAKAKINSAKTNLVFVLPAPTIVSGDGVLPNIGGNKSPHANFYLKGNTVTVVASDLNLINGPLAVDPSVVVASVSTFSQGNNEGDISFDSSNNQITEAGLSGGSISGGWSATTSLPNATYEGAAASYNGYIYEIGGVIGSTFTANVDYAPINSNGTLGSWTGTTSLPLATDALTAVAYDGYVYEIGGCTSGTCPVTTVDYALVCTGSNSGTSGCGSTPGTLGTWAAAGGIPTATSFSSSVAYNGYMYVIGGIASSATVTVDYAAISGSGGVAAPSSCSGTTTGDWCASTTTSNGNLPAATELANSVAYNGYLYELGGEASGAITAVTDFVPINSNGSIGTWVATTSLPASVLDATAAVYDGYVYEIGGCTTTSCGTSVTTTDYAPINSNGTLGSWTATASLGTGTHWDTSAVYKGYVYEIGGCTGGTCSTAGTAVVDYAPIDPAGVVGSWAATTSLGVATDQLAAVAYNGYIYEIGGSTTTAASNTVKYASINSNGTLGSWTATTSLPVATYSGSAVAYNGYIYEIGGATSSFTAVVTYDSISSTGALGGSWTATTSLPVATENGSAVAYNGYIYEIGGATSTGATASVDYDSISSTGALGGSWTATTSLPVATELMSSVDSNGYVYEMGGLNSSFAALATVDYAYLNSNGTLGSWTATTSLPAARYEASSMISNGYVYEVGGNITGSSIATVDYAPINSNGTLGSWTPTTSLLAATSWAAAVAYNGYAYEIGGFTNDNTTVVDYAPINNGGPGTLSSWTAGTSFTGGTTMPNRFDFGTAAYNGYLYVLGGDDNNTTSTADCLGSGGPYPLMCGGVFQATISAGGAVGSWTADSSATFSAQSFTMPDRDQFGVAVYNGDIYVIGGFDADTTSVSGDCDANGYCNGVFYASINASSGAIGAWTPQTPAYFTSASSTMPARTTSSGTVEYNGYIYVMGGTSDSNTGDCTTGSSSPYYCNGVFYASISTAPGSGGALQTGTCGSYWCATTAFPSSSPTMPARNSFAAIAYNGYLYVMGGQTATSAGDCTSTGNYCNGVFEDQFHSSGGIGSTWTQTTSFNSTQARQSFNAVAYDGYMYIINGFGPVSAGDCTTSFLAFLCSGVFEAPINYGGTLGSWTEAGVSTSASPAMNVAAGAGVTVYKGNLYTLGGLQPSSSGSCNSNFVCGNVDYAGLQSIPRVGDYSHLIDFTGSSTNDPTPISILTSGGDCGLGNLCTTNSSNPGLGGTSGLGGIRINYKFASNTCAQFNSATTLPSTSQFIGVPQPLVYTTNGCSTTTNIGRYMWVQYILDDSETATFPDSTGNHTSVSSFTVYYHPASGYRLRGGATFSNGSLQSLDAPP